MYSNNIVTRTLIQNIFIAHKPMDYNGYKIVCYYGAWAVYRQKPMAFNVTDIDPHACTHLIYAFAGLDEATNKIISLDPEVDIKEGIKIGVHPNLIAPYNLLIIK